MCPPAWPLVTYRNTSTMRPRGPSCRVSVWALRDAIPQDTTFPALPNPGVCGDDQSHNDDSKADLGVPPLPLSANVGSPGESPHVGTSDKY